MVVIFLPITVYLTYSVGYWELRGHEPAFTASLGDGEPLMRDKRNLSRLKLLYHLRVLDRNNYKRLGHVADIHTQGMMVLSEHRLEPKVVHDIKIALPDALDGREEIELSATVLWCVPYVNPLFFQSGFKFHHIDRMLVQALEALIQRYGFLGVFQNHAVHYYRGIEGYNCAQAVSKMFQVQLSVDDDQITDLAACGGGNAEDGICGALHAIRQLAGNDRNRRNVIQRFEQEVGSLYCDEILALGRLSCAGCIYTACRILQDILGLGDS
jgi:hypothetical protein